jgi:hypothetical protein
VRGCLQSERVRLEASALLALSYCSRCHAANTPEGGHRQMLRIKHHSLRPRSRARQQAFVPHAPRTMFWSSTNNLTSLLYRISLLFMPRSTRQTSALRRRYILIFELHTHFRYQYFKHCMHANNACSSLNCHFS